MRSVLLDGKYCGCTKVTDNRLFVDNLITFFVLFLGGIFSLNLENNGHGVSPVPHTQTY